MFDLGLHRRSRSTNSSKRHVRLAPPWRRLGWIAAPRRKAFPMEDLLLDGWSRSIARTSEGPQHSHFPRPALLRSIARLSLFISGHKDACGTVHSAPAC